VTVVKKLLIFRDLGLGFVVLEATPTFHLMQSLKEHGGSANLPDEGDISATQSRVPCMW
jgi:hypothetical protein